MRKHTSRFAKLWECARVLASLFENHSIEDAKPLLRDEETTRSQREFHSIVGDAHLNTALCRDGAQVCENFATDA
jgi:hypothetical protein